MNWFPRFAAALSVIFSMSIYGAVQRSTGAGKETLYVPESQAAHWVKANKTSQAKQAAQLIEQYIARVPQAIWLTNTDLSHATRIVSDAKQKGQVPVFVTYNIPGRDNGNYSSGGLSGPGEYGKWLRDFAKVIGSNKAMVIIEPDALGLADGLTDADRKRERYEMIADAVAVLKAQSKCLVYVEVAQWLSKEKAVEALKLAKCEKATGFCLNTSGYDRTEKCIAYGTELSKVFGNKHFIIDTSRNGNGAWESSEKDPWCNPPGRRLGIPSTFTTNNPLVDAFIWIKNPGESDGSCRGGPDAGQFWPEYAAGLIRNPVNKVK